MEAIKFATEMRFILETDRYSPRRTQRVFAKKQQCSAENFIPATLKVEGISTTVDLKIRVIPNST